MTKSLFALFAFALMAISCKKADEITSFNIENNSEITINKTIMFLDAEAFDTPPIESGSENEFEGNNTAKNLIQDVTLTDLILTITSPQDGNFDFLEKIEIFIDADGLDETLLASKSNIADGTTVLTMETTGADLTSYIQQETYSLRVKTTTDQTIGQDTDINIYTKIRVNAGVL